MMGGKRGNLEKDVKMNCSDFDLEEAAALSSKLKNQVRDYLPNIDPGAEQQQHYVMEAGLLCTSRKLLLLGKVHHGGQHNSRKTGFMRGEQGKVWDCHLKRKIALLISLLPECHKSNKKSHLPHTHTWRRLRVTAKIILLIPALCFSKDYCSLALLFLFPANYICMNCAAEHQSISGNIFNFQTLQAEG